jgi:Type I phosphodiesterase / nucleotide pyrophosphatase
VIGVLPTVTYPSHTTLITGVEPAVHGIYDNQIFDPENRSNGAWFWYARSIKVPTLPTAARARGLRAAAVTWPVTIGMDLDYLAPEYIGSRHEESVNMLRALSVPRTLLDAAEAARGKPFGWPQDDRDPANGIREVWTRADLATRGSHPDAAFGLDVVDDFYTGGGHDVLLKPSSTKGGHGFGPDRRALHSSLVLAGPTVTRRGSVGVIRMTQIAPTLASILGVSCRPKQRNRSSSRRRLPLRRRR